MEQDPLLQTRPPRPKNWLVESILVTLFCCLPLGIVGIVYASGVNRKYDNGEYDDALKASKDAGQWTKIGFFIGLAIGIIYAILMFLGVGAALLGSHS